MRARLIFPLFLAELFRLDTAAMATVDPDGPDPLEGGYDPDFKEPVVVDQDDDGIGERVRQEHPPVRVPCQVDTKVFEELRMFASGKKPDGGSGRGVVVVQIPARPFLRPAFKQFEKGAQKRFLGRVADLMGMAAGPTPDKGGSAS